MPLEICIQRSRHFFRATRSSPTADTSVADALPQGFLHTNGDLRGADADICLLDGDGDVHRSGPEANPLNPDGDSQTSAINGHSGEEGNPPIGLGY
jgi:hypothetical protein